MKTLKNRFFLLSLLLIVFIQVSLAKSESQVTMTFEKNQYTITYSIDTTCSSELSLDILFGYSHLVKIATQAEKITLLEQGDNWYKVQYDYNYVFFKTHFVYKTYLHHDENTISFEMVSYWGNSDFIPKPIRAYGRHTIIPKTGYTTILSTETCIFEKPVDPVKQVIMKHESGVYISNLEAYLHKMENLK